MPPRLRTVEDTGEHRHASWLELFLDLVFVVALLAGMLAIAALAVQIEDVAHGSSTGFALCYIALRSIMLGLYARAWRTVPAARPLIARYGLGYGRPWRSGPSRSPSRPRRATRSGLSRLRST